MSLSQYIYLPSHNCDEKLVFFIRQAETSSNLAFLTEDRIIL